MAHPESHAPGWPGIPARWTSADKAGVGTSLSEDSRLWFTISHGIVNEIYYPRIDRACIRDMEMIVADGHGFISEEKRQAAHGLRHSAPGVPAYQLRNTCLDQRYRIDKEIIADPFRPALLQRTRFTALSGSIADYHLYTLVAPHLNNRGGNNNAWVGDYKGCSMLFAERNGSALALACSVPWRRRSVGFVGSSDGYQDLVQHNEMTWEYTHADNGNVALMAEIDVPTDGSEFLIVLAFGSDVAEAGHRARAALHDGFDTAYAEYARQWDRWQDSLLRLDADRAADPTDRYRISTIVMRTHESTGFPGGLIASLAVPWGFAMGDENLGGYHLVWPRDLCETAGGLLAAGSTAEVRRVLAYLQATQEWDGHWGQNMWLDGTAYWNGIQMDETALPILLVDLARREGTINEHEITRHWLMVRRAAQYIVTNGPVSPQDRWEEDPGYSPFTVAAQVAALLVAADFCDEHDDALAGRYFRETADAWNDAIDRWMYATGTSRADIYDVDGYYVRIAPIENEDGTTNLQSRIPVLNVVGDLATAPAAALISPDALALVRFGLRRADDPRILNTVRIIDAQLKVDTPYGPSWHRYNGDGYGEHADGAPFDGTGVGRAWPLLTGERAHYEIAAGNFDEARRLLASLEAFTSEGGLMPEQIWDSADIPERELFFGKPAGSAMPLVWAHAEYVKLRRSLRDGAIFDLPPQTVARYLEQQVTSPFAIWRFNHKASTMLAGKTLRIETMAAAVIHWSADGWATASDVASQDPGVGVHVTDVPTSHLASGTCITFTMHWSDADRWEGTDFTILVTGENNS